jgi:hypothetical protein
LKVDGNGQLGWATDSTTDSTKLPLSGGTLTGHLTVNGEVITSDDININADNKKLNIGTGADLQLYHDSSSDYSYIEHTHATGHFVIRNTGADSNLYLQARLGEQSIVCHDDGAVELYNNGNLSATTASDDFDVYRRLRLFAARDMSGHQLAIGQWDGSNHRIEGDANRPIFITAYNSSGIKFGYQSGEKVQIDNSGLKIVLGGTLDFYAGRTTYRHTGSYGEFKNNTGDLYCAAAGDLRFYTDNSFSTERLRIKTDGNIEASGNLKTNNLSGRNIIINGDMRVVQRGTGPVSMSAAGNDIPACDRWNYNRNGVTSTVAQVAETPAGRGFKYSLKWTSTSAVGSIAAGNVVKFSYRIERQDIERLGYGSSNGKKATLSFWAKGSLAGKIGVACIRDSRITSHNVDMTANTWELHKIVIPIDTSTAFSGDANANGMDIGICWGAGSNSTSGATNGWIGFHNAYSAGFTAGQQGAYLTTNGSTFQITGVQLEVGSIATEFEHKSYAEELLRCQRYYQRWKRGYLAGNSVGTSDINIGIPLLVPLRAVPTIPALNMHRSGNKTVTVSIVSYEYSDVNSMILELRVGNWTGGNQVVDEVAYVLIPSGDTMELNAEL